eukprot:5258965-Pyramimonas_sp.AAC.1
MDASPFVTHADGMAPAGIAGMVPRGSGSAHGCNKVAAVSCTACRHEVRGPDGAHVRVDWVLASDHHAASSGRTYASRGYVS